MLKRLVYMLIGLGVFMTSFSPTQAMASAPVVERLQNGLTVLIQKDDRFPLVSERLYVHAGSAYETPDQAGVSHLLEHMVFKGTKKRAPGEVAADVEAVGGSINAGTSMDYTVYYVDMPSKEWKLGLDVIADMAFGATIDPKELESERKVVLSELERGEDDPNRVLFKRTQQNLWPGTAYGWPVIGYPETVKAQSAEDIRAYVKLHYQPQAMTLVVVGDVEVQEALDEAERVFGGLANDRSLTPMSLLPSIPVMTGPKLTVERGAWNKVYCMLALPGPSLHSDEEVGLEVLGQLLGGDRTSFLYRKYRYDRQLVDEISCSYMSMERTGMLVISATLDADKAQEFWRELTADLGRIKAVDFTDEQLARARLNLEDSMFRSKETLNGLASKLGYFQFFEGSYKAEDDYIYALRHVDREQLQGLLEAYFHSNRLAGTFLVPQDAKLDEDGLSKTLLAAWPANANDEDTDESANVGALTTVDLGKGRTLVLMPDSTLPYASLDLVFSGGNQLLQPDQQGLASLTARVLTKGAAGQNATSIQEYLADRAASVGADAGIQQFAMRARYPSRFSGDVLKNFRETLLQPDFPEEEIARERISQAASIKARRDRPLGLAFMELFPFLFPDDPLGYYRDGQPEEIMSFERQDIVDFWNKQRSQPFVLSVCGTFDPDEVEGLARDLAAKLDAIESPKPGEPRWTDKAELDLHLAERNQAHLLLLFKAPPRGHEDGVGLSLLRDSISGMGGPLFRELRDKQGLGYTVSAMFWQTPMAGFMTFYIGTEPAKMDQAREGFHKVIEELRTKPLPDEDVDRGKRQMLGDYYRDHQSLGSRSAETASLLNQGFPADYNELNIAKAQKLSPEDLRQLAEKYLVWDKAYTVTVTP